MDKAKYLLILYDLTYGDTNFFRYDNKNILYQKLREFKDSSDYAYEVCKVLDRSKL